jgi:RNA polymerase subunit RPABC4/transcription elongation factor Spt4
MARWKCPNCGRMIPDRFNTCIYCNSPNVSQEESMKRANIELERAAKKAGYENYGRMGEVKSSGGDKPKTSRGSIQLRYVIILIVGIGLFFWFFYNTLAGKIFSTLVNPVLDVFKGNVSIPFLGTFGPLFKWFIFGFTVIVPLVFTVLTRGADIESLIGIGFIALILAIVFFREIDAATLVFIFVCWVAMITVATSRGGAALVQNLAITFALIDVVLGIFWAAPYVLSFTPGGELIAECLPDAKTWEDVTACFSITEKNQPAAPSGEKIGGTKFLDVSWINLHSPVEGELFTIKVNVGAKTKEEGIIDGVVVSGVLTDQELTGYEISRAIKLIPSSCTKQEPCKIIPENKPEEVTLDSERKIECENTEGGENKECNFIGNKFVNMEADATYHVSSQSTYDFYVAKTEYDLPKNKECELGKTVDIDKPCVGPGPVDVTVWFGKKYYKSGNENNKIRMYVELDNKGSTLSYALIKDLKIVRLQDIPQIDTATCVTPWGDNFMEGESFQNFRDTSLKKSLTIYCDYTIPTDFTPENFATLKVGAQVEYDYVERITTRRLIESSRD